MPERVGRYELLFPVGTGGMGTVYLAQAEVVPGVTRNVAIKLMHSELRANPEIAPQLMAEAQLAASIKHPNVVAVLEAGDSNHGVYLAMDYVEGTTLAGLLRKARKREEQVPIRVAAKVLRDALTGLHAAHELKSEDGRPLDIVHRDFSPHNILVGADGISRLTDFGIAKALSNIGTTATGVVKGKIGYMSPEQASGTRIDRRTDVWAAGVVAWESLTAKRLFRGTNDAATLLQIVSGKRPPRVSRVRPDVPADLDAVIDEALRHDPNERLATAQELRRRLEASLADHGGIADEEEVAEFVQELMADDLAKMRERAKDVVRLRSEIADIAAATEQESVSSSYGSPPSLSDFDDPSGKASPTIGEDSDTGTHAALTAVTPRRGAASRYWLWGAALLLGGGAAAAFTLRAKQAADEPMASMTSVPASSSSAPQVAVPNTQATAPPNAPDGLTVVANAEMAQLVVDGKALVLPDPTREVTLPPSAETPRHLVALTADGRRVETELLAEQRKVTVTFPEASAAAASPRPASRPIPRPTPKSGGGDDELADSPYGAQ